MAIPTEIYVDPSIAAASGAGTIGDPYGDVQHALDTATRDASNGNRFNILTGTAEILAAALSLATYGTPTNTAQLIIQGYATAAGDGDFEAGTGQGGFDCAGFALFTSTSIDNIHFRHLTIDGNGNTTDIIKANREWSVTECTLHDTTGVAIQVNHSNCLVRGNHIYDVATGINNSSGFTECSYNFIDQVTGTATPALAIDATSYGNCYRNTIYTDGAGDGIKCDNFSKTCNNTVLSNGGTGQGIRLSASNQELICLTSNYVEGFSGAGGIGIDYSSAARGVATQKNAVWNCTTAYGNLADFDLFEADDNETLSATGLAKSGAITFANRRPYFAAADSGNMRGGAYGA